MVQSSDWVRSFPHFQVESLHEKIGLTPILVYSTGLRASSRSIQLSQWVSRWSEGSDQTILGLPGLHGVRDRITPRVVKGNRYIVINIVSSYSRVRDSQSRLPYATPRLVQRARKASFSHAPPAPSMLPRCSFVLARRSLAAPPCSL